MGILRSDRVSGLGGANAINGSVKFASDAGAGQGTYLEVSDPDGDIKFGTSDWTIEFWMYANSIDTSEQENDLASILDFGYGIGSGASTTGAWFAVHQEDATLHLGFNNANQVQSSNFLSANTWHHIAVTRTSNTAKIYGDGTQVATVSCSQDFTDATWRFLDIGSQPASGVERNFDGYISNLRIIKGTALYTAAFTPPTTRLEKTSDTVLLCCQSPGNAFKEETGKSIVVGTVSKTPGPTASHFAPDVGEDHGTTFTDNTKFDTLSYMVPPGGTTAQSNRGRAVFGLGNAPSNVNNIEYVQIQSEGNAVDFGDLITAQTAGGAGSSSTRGIFGGGQAPGKTNIISYVTIATTSNATDFGDLSVVRDFVGGLSNSTRGLFLGGRIEPASANSDTVDYVTIATTGNAADFGNLQSIRHGGAGCASLTRGLFGGGSPPGGGMNTIDYFTIATAGNGTDYGDLSVARVQPASLSSSTRGIWSGGTTPSHSDVIDYVTIASTGNATDFGNLTVARRGHGAASNSLRGIFNSGEGSPALVNTIDYVTIATTANALDFGDCTLARLNNAGCSDSHGGIS